MKKLFSVLCAAAFCFAALTSCNKEEELKPLNPSFPSVAEGLLEISSADSLVVPFVIGEAKGNLVDVSAVSTNSLYNTQVEVAENNKEGNITIYAPEYILDATEFDVEVNIKDEENAREVKTIFTVTPKLYDNIIVAEKPANCYIATPGAVVKFPANIGNSSVKADAFAIDLLWQDEIGLFSKVVSYEDGIATVAFAKEKAGNAVFVGRQADSTIVWSWHVWVAAEQPKDVAVAGVTFMDRNIGTQTTDFKKAGYTGTVYNWGRKDAFAGLDDNGAEKPMYDANGNVVSRSFVEVTETNCVELATKNPLTVYYQTSTNYKKGNYSWLTSDYSALKVDDVKALWDNSTAKAVADPCPAGYTIASQADWTAVKDAATDPVMLIDETYKAPEEVSSKWAEKYVNQYEHQVQYRGANLAGLLVIVGGEINSNSAKLNIANGVGALQPSASIWTSSMDPDFKDGCSYSNFRGVSVKQNASWNTTEAVLKMNALNVKGYQNLSYALPVRCVKEK